MKAEIVEMKAHGKCRMCKPEKKIPKGSKALKVAMKTAQSPYAPISAFFCLEHAKEIKLMFSALKIPLGEDYSVEKMMIEFKKTLEHLMETMVYQLNNGMIINLEETEKLYKEMRSGYPNIVLDKAKVVKVLSDLRSLEADNLRKGMLINAGYSKEAYKLIEETN